MLEKSFFITKNETITDALKKLNESAEGVLLVINEKDELIGTLSDGDIRRAILSGKSFENHLDEIYNSSPFVLSGNYSHELAEKIFLENKITLIPITDEKKRVIDFLSWEHFFDKDFQCHEMQENIPSSVIVMAGGKGTRMAPFTNVLPKPLVPIGEKTIVELIIDEFRKYGIEDYHFTLNYKGKMIEAYFESIERTYNTRYVWEKEFNGTAGSLLLLKDQELPENFFVSNCDIIVKANYADVYKHHIDTEADLTLLVSIQHFQIPYGVVEFKEEGEITGLKEKPEYIFPVNTGVYLLKRDLIDLIPENEVFHMTHLIEKVISLGGKVVSYPVKESDYIDIGQWKEYRSALKIMGQV